MMTLGIGKWTFRSSTRRMGSPDVSGSASDMGETRFGVAIRNLNQFRSRGFALVQDRAAARCKGAAGRQAGEIGRLPLDRHQAPPAAAIETGDGRHQARGIGMLWPGVELPRRG